MASTPLISQDPTAKHSDRQVTALNQQVADLKSILAEQAILNGILLDPVTVTTSLFQLNHGLGRKYRGYIIVRCYGTGFYLAESVTQAAPDIYITLAASANSTGALWVF